MARKTSSTYSKEYATLLEKTVALQVRISNRAKSLCRTHPEAPIGMGATGRELEKLGHRSTLQYIDIIREIEKHNERKAGAVQTTIFPTKS